MAMQEKALKRKAPSTSQKDATAHADNTTIGDETEESIEKELMDVDWKVRPVAILLSPYAERFSSLWLHDAGTEVLCACTGTPS